MVEILIKVHFEDCWGMPRDWALVLWVPKPLGFKEYFDSVQLNILCLKSFPSWWFNLSMATVQFLKLSILKTYHVIGETLSNPNIKLQNQARYSSSTERGLSQPPWHLDFDQDSLLKMYYQELIADIPAHEIHQGAIYVS